MKKSFGLIDEKGNLTNAGALLADESPVRHSRLFCTRWNGLTKASGIVDALDDKEYTGSLVTLLQAGTDFVRNNSKKAWSKVGDGRIEMPDYPDRAVLEGVVNALIHRNYMEIGSEVHIDKSDVIWDIVRLIRLKVITYDDLSDFSVELQMEVKRILEMNR